MLIHPAVIVLLFVLALLLIGGGVYGRRAGWYGPPGRPYGSAPGQPYGDANVGVPPGQTGGHPLPPGSWRPSSYGYYHAGLIGLVLLIIIVAVLLGLFL